MVAVGVMISYFINCKSELLVILTLSLTLGFLVGISLHMPTGFGVWRIPFGFQLVPAGIMAFGLLTVKESPRWLASKGRIDTAITNLAYMRKLSPDDERIRSEMAEIEAAIEEEREARKGLGLREAFLGKGNFIRFVIAVMIFLLQQWGGQNSVNYYAPQIFQSVSDCMRGVLGRRAADGCVCVDRVQRHVQFASGVGDLRYRQGGRNGAVRVLPRRLARAQAVSVHLLCGHGRAVLHHRRAAQDPPAAGAPR